MVNNLVSVVNSD